MTGPQKYTIQTPNLRRYDWMSRVIIWNVFFFSSVFHVYLFFGVLPGTSWDYIVVLVALKALAIFWDNAFWGLKIPNLHFSAVTGTPGSPRLYKEFFWTKKKRRCCDDLGEVGGVIGTTRWISVEIWRHVGCVCVCVITSKMNADSDEMGSWDHFSALQGTSSKELRQNLRS